MRSSRRGRCALGVVVGVALAACGARTELVTPSAEPDAVTVEPDAGEPDASGPDPRDAGPDPIGPCFVCRSPLVQECSYCLIQGLDTTHVCPVAHAPPSASCQSLLEDHVTPKGTHFTCYYCL